MLRIGGAFACVWGVYVVAINVFLSTPLFEKVIDREPETVDIHFERGWSLWPSRIHARKLSIRGRDSNVEWILKLDRVSFEVSLLQLAKQRFTVAMADGSGISFRARRRLEAPPTSPRDYADLPPIDGLEAYAVRPEKTQRDIDEVWNDKAYKLWTVHLENVHARDVREVWIDGGHFEGSADITGRFYLKPVRSVNVGPCHVVADGHVRVGQGPVIAEPVHADVTMHIDELDPRVTKGEAFLHHVSVDAEARARVPASELLPLPVPDDVRISGMVDVPRLVFRMRQGVLASDSHLEATAPAASVFTKRHLFTGALALRGDIEHEQLGFRLDATQLAMRRGEHGAGAPDASTFRDIMKANAVVVGDSRALDVSHLLHDLHTVLDVRDVSVDDARAFSEYIPAKARVKILRGSATAVAHLESWFEEHRLAGHAAMQARDFDAILAHVHARAATTVRASFDSFHWDEKRFDRADIDVKLDEGEITIASARAPTMLRAGGRVSARVHDWNVEDDALVLDEAKAELTQVRLGKGINVDQVGARATSAHFSIGKPLHGVNVEASIRGGHVRDAEALETFLPTGSSFGFAVGAYAKEGAFSGDARLHIVRRVASGDVKLRAANMGVRGKKVAAAGDITLDAKFERWDLRQKTLAVPYAHLEMKRVHGQVAGSDGEDFAAPRVLVDASSSAFSLESPSFENCALKLVVDDAELHDARALQAFFPSHSETQILSGTARANVRLDLDAHAQRATGTIDVALHRAGIRFEQTELTGDFFVNVKAVGYDAAASAIDVSGSSLVMSNIAARHATVEAHDWTGKISIEKGRLRVGEDPGLDADVKVDASDANPLVAIVFRRDLPGVLAGLTQLPHLYASAHLVLAPRRFELHDAIAGGGDFNARGGFVSAGEARRGAFIVDKGPLAVGVRVSDDEVALRFFGLDGWMREQSQVVSTPLPLP